MESGGGIPVAPASNNASACTNPRPRAAPLTSTTLSTRLNSGSRFVVPRYVGGFLSRRAAASASGGLGGPRERDAFARGRIVENARVREGLWVRSARAVVRGSMRSVVFIFTVEV